MKMLRLRPYEPFDAQTIIPWIGDEAAFRKWCADRYDSYPITAEDMNDNYKKCAESGGFFPMTAVDDSGIVGHLIMRFTDDEKTVIRFGFVILDDKMRGKGYGGDMLREAIGYAFEKLNAKKITLGVFDNNEAAYRCYRSVGFSEITGKTETFRVFNEEWKCIEMELNRKCSE